MKKKPAKKTRKPASRASASSAAPKTHKVKVFAYMTYEESRIIEITSEELLAFHRGSCDSRIEVAFWDNEGDFVESSTSDISGDRRELVSP